MTFNIEEVVRRSHYQQECLSRWCANKIVRKFLHVYDIGYAEPEEEVTLKVEGILEDIKPFLMERMSQVVNGDLWHKEYAEVRSGSAKHIQIGLDRDWQKVDLYSCQRTEEEVIGSMELKKLEELYKQRKLEELVKEAN